MLTVETISRVRHAFLVIGASGLIFATCR